MADYLGSIAGTVVTGMAVVFTVANGIGPVTMISGGSVNDRFGPGHVIRIGAVLFGGGMALCGFAKSKEMLTAAYGLGVGLGNGMIYGCTVANSVKFFPDRRGFAGGLATAFYGIGSIVMPPVAAALMAKFGVTSTFKILGCAIPVLVFAASFLVKRCPPDFVPEGWNPPAKTVTDAARDKNWKEMIRDPMFCVMLLLLLCGAFSGLMVISQASPVARRMVGMSPVSAAAAVSVLALFNTAGRVLAGFLSDRLGYIKTIAAVFIVSIIGLARLFFCAEGTVPQFYTGLICVGLAFGSVMGMFPGFTAEQFGSKNNSVNYGIMFIGFASAGYFGPTLMSVIYSTTGTYQRSFIAAACFSALGLALTALFGRALKKRAG
jgi:MFS family permease